MGGGEEKEFRSYPNTHSAQGEKSVRQGAELPFGHHRNWCSVQIGIGVREGADFTVKGVKSVTSKRY